MLSVFPPQTNREGNDDYAHNQGKRGEHPTERTSGRGVKEKIPRQERPNAAGNYYHAEKSNYPLLGACEPRLAPSTTHCATH